MTQIVMYAREEMDQCANFPQKKVADEKLRPGSFCTKLRLGTF